MSTKKLQIIGGAILQPDWEETDPTFASFIKNKPVFPAAAMSGSFNDLKDIPVIDTTVSEGSENAVTGGAVFEQLSFKANTADLNPVATSGDYKDLSNTPGLGDDKTAGFTKLYTGVGGNIDGAMTQLAATSLIYEAKPRITSILLPFESWAGDGPYTQEVSINGVTPNSKLDLQADDETMSAVVEGGFSVTMKNENGAVTAYAVGEKPTIDLILQVIITESIKDVNVSVIWGSPLVGTGASGGFKVSNVAPSSTRFLWIDTSNSNLLKYYDGSKWVPISAAWG